MPVMNKSRKFESVVQSWKESNGESIVGIGGKKSSIDLKYWLQRGNQSIADVNLLDKRIHTDCKGGYLELEQPSHHSYSSSSSNTSGRGKRYNPNVSSAPRYSELEQDSYPTRRISRERLKERRRGSRQSYDHSYMQLSSPKSEERSRGSSSSSSSTQDEDSYFVTPRTNILCHPFHCSSSHESKPPKPRRSGIERSRRPSSSSSFTQDYDPYFITPRTNVSRQLNPRYTSRDTEPSQQISVSPLIVPDLKNAKLDCRPRSRAR